MRPFLSLSLALALPALFCPVPCAAASPAAPSPDAGRIIPPELAFVVCPGEKAALEMLRRHIEGDDNVLFFDGLERTGCTQMSERETRISMVLDTKDVLLKDGSVVRYFAFSGMSERGATWGIVNATRLESLALPQWRRMLEERIVGGKLMLPRGIVAAWACRRSGDAARLLRERRTPPDAARLRKGGCTPVSGPLEYRNVLGHAMLTGSPARERDGVWYALAVRDGKGAPIEILYWSDWEGP